MKEPQPDYTELPQYSHKPGDRIKLTGLPKRRLVFPPHSVLTITQVFGDPVQLYMCVNELGGIGTVKPMDISATFNPFKEVDYFLKVLRSINNNTPFKGRRMLSIKDYCTIKGVPVPKVYQAIKLGTIALCKESKMIDWDKYGTVPFKETKTKLKA